MDKAKRTIPTPLEFGQAQMAEEPSNGYAGSPRMIDLAALHSRHLSNNKYTRNKRMRISAKEHTNQEMIRILSLDYSFRQAVRSNNVEAAARIAVQSFHKMIPDYLQTEQGEQDCTSAQRVEPYPPGVRSMKQEILDLEDSIPWTCVRRAWKARRPSWRRQIRHVELVTGFAAKLKELKDALLLDDDAPIGFGSSWRTQLELCIQGRGSSAQLASVWDEMKNTVRAWLHGPNLAHLDNESFHVSAAVRTMNLAFKNGGDVLQAPIESIMKLDSGRLLNIRDAMEYERHTILSRMTYDSSHVSTEFGHQFQETDFDSGHETQDDEDATDLDSKYDIY